MSKAQSVPKQMQPLYDQIVAIKGLIPYIPQERGQR